MGHHYITKCEENGQKYAEAWFQIDSFNRSFCFQREKLNCKEDSDVILKRLA